MTERIGIIGVGETNYQPVDERALEEMVHAGSRAALADAGLDRDAIDNVVVCASDLEDGRAISSMIAAGPAGSYRRDFIKTTDTGVHALGLAAMRLQAGPFETALVASWAKQSETDEGTIRPLEADPFYRRGTGLGHVTGHAAVAAGYADRHEDAARAADRVVAKNTANAAAAPVGHRSIPVATDEAAASSVVAWPLREAHLPTPSDGACALVLATESAASEYGADPVWLEGVAWETGSYDADDRVGGDLPTLASAAGSAFDEAGIDPNEVDCAEVHTPSAYHELLACEALGLQTGSAIVKVLDGSFDRDGAVPVNPSGGAFAANPLIATGLARIAAAAHQLREEAGETQVAGARTAVAHATAGFTDQVHGVSVLGGRGR